MSALKNNADTVRLLLGNDRDANAAALTMPATRRCITQYTSKRDSSCKMTVLGHTPFRAYILELLFCVCLY